MSFQQSDAREANYRAAEAHDKRVQKEAEAIFELFRTVETSLLIPALVELGNKKDKEDLKSWERNNYQTIAIMGAVAEDVLERIKNSI